MKGLADKYNFFGLIAIGIAIIATPVDINAQGFGIGVASPANTLDVEGDAVIGATYSGTSAAPANGLLIEGNVGIGNTTGTEPLHITADAGHDNIQLQENSGIEFWKLGVDVDGDLNFTNDDGTIYIAFEDSGEVGIGISAPTDPLHILSDAGHDAIHIEEPAGGDGEDWQIGVDATGDLNFEDSGGGAEVTFEDGGDVGMGTASPGHQLHIVDDNATDGRAGLYVDGSGASGGRIFAGYFEKSGASTTNIGGYFSATGATNNYAIIIPSGGGTMGLGHASPTLTAQIRSDDAANSSVTDVMALTHSTSGTAANGIGIGVVFELEDAGGNVEEAGSIDVYYEDVSDGSENTTMAFNIDIDGASTEVMRIDGTAGYIGISQSNPRAALDVVFADATTAGVSDVMILSHELSGFAIPSAGIGTGLVYYVEDAGGSEEQGSIDVLLDDVTEGSEDATMTFRMNQNGTITEMMRIDGTAGRVGIGSTGPVAKLDVATAIASETGIEITQSAATGTNYAVYSTNTGAATTNVAGYFTASGATSNYALIIPNSSGYVGIGTVAPLDILHVVAGTDHHNIRLEETGLGSEYWVAGIDAAGDLNFENDDASVYLTLENGGQIGVGSGATSPEANLDVAGDFAMRENSVALVNGDNDDVILGGYSFIRITGPTAVFAITGMAGGVDGRVIAIYNTVAFTLTFNHEDLGSVASARIFCDSGANRSMDQYGLAFLMYSNADSRWILMTNN